MTFRLAVVLLVSLVLGCESKTPPPSQQESDKAYAERMAREHKADQPVASPATEVLPAAPIKTQTVVYGTVKNQEVRGHLAYPANAEGGLPAVIVYHEWWGLNDNIKSMANQLAGQGYVALAADLYLGRATDKPDEAKALLDEALKDTDAIGQNIRAAHTYLKEQIKATRVGTIGWCFGGGTSFDTALMMPSQVDATVIYYGYVTSDPAKLEALEAPILGLFGGADPGIPVEEVKKFEAALKSLGKSAEIHIYDGAQHAFANPSGTAYKADAAADAWQKSLTFLATHLKGG